MSYRRLPHFSQFGDRSDVFVTKADEAEASNLEPWIQWYSIHTGLPFKEHGVFRLTDGLSEEHDDIWRMLIRNGKRVIDFSSMNARPFGALEGSVFLPDPWCSAAMPHLPQLQDFQNFVSSMVREYRNTATGSHKIAARFITLMASKGLIFSTVSAVVKRLMGEKLGGSRARWQRAPLLDVNSIRK